MSEKRLTWEGDNGVAHRVILVDTTGEPVNPSGGAGGGDMSGTEDLLTNIDTAVGAQTAAAAGSDGTGDYGVVAALKRGLLNWAALMARVATLGQKAAAGSMPVVVASDQSALPVVGYAAIPAASMTRPADTTAYAAGDLVGNSTTAGSVTPLAITAARVAAGSLLASRVRLRKSGTELTAATFRVYLFSAAPTVANGDNGALSIAGSANCIGWADVSMATRADSTTANPFSDGAFGFGDLNSLVALASGQTVWALIEARAAYTPASGETFAVTLEVAQN